MRYLNFIIIMLSATLVYGGTVVDSLTHDGTTRYYRLFIPDSISDTNNLPLVFNLHGLGSNAVQQEVYSQLNEVADTAGFMVCYPEGIDNAWNSGFLADGVDDSGFIGAVIDKLHEEHKINLNKVYSCGMSNGGYQSYYMACELPGRFAAVASVTGSMLNSVLNNCDPQKPMPVMQIHGTEDPTVAYNGSALGASIEDVVNFWVENNECSIVGDTIFVEDIDTTDHCTAIRIEYLNGLNNSEVIFYKIEGGGHTWPDASIDIIGVTNKDFNASAAIWEFFNQFELENVTSIQDDFEDRAVIEVYPNPFTETIHLNPFYNIDLVEVFNLKGQLLKQVKNFNGQQKVDLNILNSGVYILKTTSGTKIQSARIIKY